jgi:hypothetical protein
MAYDTTPLVRERAYFLWEKAGMPRGRDHEFWAQASREIEGERDPLHKNAHGQPVPRRSPVEGQTDEIDETLAAGLTYLDDKRPA